MNKFVLLLLLFASCKMIELETTADLRSRRDYCLQRYNTATERSKYWAQLARNCRDSAGIYNAVSNRFYYQAQDWSYKTDRLDHLIERRIVDSLARVIGTAK